MTSIHLFQWLYQHFSVGMFASVNTLENRVISAARGPITAILCAWVISQSMLFWRGWIDQEVLIRRVLELFVVLAILRSPAVYEAIGTFFMVTLPAFAASAAGGGNPTSLPQQLDIMNNEFTVAALTVYQHSRGLVGPVILEAELNALDAVFALSLILLFFVYWLSLVIMGLLCIIGPIMILAFLFDFTREIADRWLAKLIGLAITQLLIVVLLAMFMTGTMAFINSEFTSSYGAMSIPQELIVLIDVMAFVIALAFTAVGAWAIGAYLGGGVAFNISSIVNPLRWSS